MPYFADIQRENWSNSRLAYTQLDTPYNQPYTGKADYREHMLGNLSIFDNAKSIAENVFVDRSVYSQFDYDFSVQQSGWRSLHKSITNSRNGGPETRLLAFDFETIGMRNPYAYDGNITEIGFTETLLGANGPKVAKSHSIALGIDIQQFETLAKQLNTVFKGGGVNALDLDYKGNSGLLSDLERLSRYAGDFEDVFQMSSISGISKNKLVTIRQLSESNRFSQKAVSEGFVNLAILGGISADDYAKILGDAGFTNIDVEGYKRKQKEFTSKGFKVQTLDTAVTTKKYDTLRKRISGYFASASAEDSTYILGFNSNAFDVPVYRAAFSVDKKHKDAEILNANANALSKNNVLDLYSGIKYATRNNELALAKNIASDHDLTHTGISRRSSLEGLAQAFGISINAHNAASDTEVTNALIALEDFFGGSSLSEIMTDQKAISGAQQITNTGRIKAMLDQNVFYALESIAIDKNGTDYFSSRDRYTPFHSYGIQRGRYYKINDVRGYEDGRIAVEFLTAAKGSQDRFIKVFGSSEEAQEVISNTFIADKAGEMGHSLEYLDINEAIVEADKARRNYESLFSTQNLEYDTNRHTYIGGYERLNQYYRAYRDTVSAFSSEGITVDDRVIADIAEGRYDDTIIPILEKDLKIEAGRSVAPSMLRDFKNVFGKMQDEAEMLDYIEEQVEGKGFNNHQKTLIAGGIRSDVLEAIAEDGYEEYSSAFYRDYANASRRDMFNIGMDFGNGTTYINFEHKEQAIQSILRQTKGNNTVDGVEAMFEAIADLYERGVIDTSVSAFALADLNQAAGVKNNAFKKMLNKMKDALPEEQQSAMASAISKFSVSTVDEIQRRLLAETFVTHIQDAYVKPIKNVMTYGDYVTTGIESLSGTDYLHSFMQNKTDEQLTGGLTLRKARSTRYTKYTEDGNAVDYTAGKMFSEIIKDETFESDIQRIVSNAQNMSITMDRSEITRVLTQDLGYTEAAADTMENTFFLSATKKGEPFGLTQIKTDGKTRFITQFAYSGVKGEDAFILTNLNTDSDTGLAKTMEIMASNDMSFQDKIKLIEENNYSAVFKLPAIRREGMITDDYNTEAMTYADINGDPTYHSLNTIGVGDRGFQKVSQFSLGNYYEGDTTGLENLDIYLTDSASDVSSVWRRIRQGIIDITTDPSNIKETYSSMTRLYSSALNGILTDAPGPVGYQALPTASGWKKVLAPSVSDSFLSSQISIQPLEILTLEAAKADFLNTQKNLNVAGTISKNDRLEGIRVLASLSGMETNDTVVALDSMLKKAREGQSVGVSFDEFFYKHLMNTPMNAEQGSFANKANFTILDYLQDVAGRYKLPQRTMQTLDFIVNNKDRMSQLVKEKAAYDKKRISLIDNFLFNQFASTDTNIRPTGNQVGGSQHYILSEAEKEMGRDAVEKLQMRFGYDIMPIQEQQRRAALSDYKVYRSIDGKSDINYGQLETGVTLNVRQVSPTELLADIQNIEENFDTIFRDLYQDSLKHGRHGFQIHDESVSRELIQEVFNVAKMKANTYESRAFGRDSLLNLSLFNSPNLVTAKINAVDKKELSWLRSNYADLFATGHIKSGARFKLSDDRYITYSGPTGTIGLDDLDDFFTSGKAHLIEDTQGTESIKLFMYNEKMTMAMSEFDTSAAFDRFRHILNQAGISQSDAKKVFSVISDAVYDEILGKDVAIATDMSLIKHGTGSITYGNYMNRIFNAVQNEISGLKSKTKEKELVKQITGMFDVIGKDGKKVSYITYQDGRFFYDDSILGESGVRTQIMSAVDEIARRAERSGPFQSLWASITDDIRESERRNIARIAVTRGVNNESMGHEMKIDPRVELSGSTKFLEDIDEYNADLSDFENLNAIEVDGRYMTTAQYVNKRIFDEATDKKTLAGKRYASAKKTNEGIIASVQYMGSPEKMANSNIILDLRLDQINLVPAGSDADDLMKVGIFKIIDGKGPQYSDQLRALARQQGKNIDAISVLRLALPDGISFDNFSDKKGNKTVAKKVRQLLIPLYDITPFEGEAQYTKTARIINDVIGELKTYGRNKGIQQSKEDLNDKIQKMYRALVGDLNTEDKMSFAYQRTLKLTMKNSLYGHAEASVMPVVSGMSSNYSEWASATSDNYRQQILSDIAGGEIKYDASGNIGIDLTDSGYTTVRNGKLYYDDIVEMGEEGFKKLGIDFQKTGRDVFFNIEKYRPLIKEMEHGFFDVDYAQAIIESSNIEYYKRALESEKMFNQVNNLLNRTSEKDDKKFQQSFISIFENLTGRRIEADEVSLMFDTLTAERNAINDAFTVLGKNYLSTVGTFARSERYPTNNEGTVNDVILRYNKYLKRDDIRVTPSLIDREAGDFDGDNLVVKAYLDKDGNIVSRKDRKLYTALSKNYEQQVFTEFTDTDGTTYASRTNKEMHDLVQDVAEKMEARGISTDGKTLRTSDAIGETLQYKATMVDNYLSKSKRDELLTEIGLDDFIGYDVSDMDDDTIDQLYRAWEGKYGNMLKNEDAINAAIKSRVTKPNIGTVSNTVYRFNRALEESINYALEKGDKDLLYELQEIKRAMHVGKKGFMPETEQSFISVKHIKSAENIYRADLFTTGMNDIFRGGKYAQKGMSKVRESIGHIFKDEDVLDGYMGILSKAANLTVFNKFWNSLKLNTSLLASDNIDDVVRFAQDELIEKSATLDKDGFVTTTARRAVDEALDDLGLAFNMGYYHNDTLQELRRDQIYISDENGDIVLYKQTNDLRRKGSDYSVSFETYNLSSGATDASGSPIWGSKYTIKAKSNAQLQSMLQEKFGDYEALSVASMSDMKRFGEDTTAKVVMQRTRKFASKYIRGDEAYDYSDATSKLGKQTRRSINKYLDRISDADFDEFINQMEFIRDNSRFQSAAGRTAFKDRAYINNILAEINEEIIAKGKGKKTSTSEIFSERIKRVANDVGLARLDGVGNEYGEYLASRKLLDSSIFDGYDERIIDLRNAAYDLDGDNNADELIKSYRNQNDAYIKSLQKGMKFTTTSDIDRVFGWDGSGDMRVGFNTRNSLFGRSFSDLSDEDVKEIMDFATPDDADDFDKYSIQQTKERLREYLKENPTNNNNGLQGAREQDIMNLTKEINDKIIEEGSKATEEGLNAKGKKEAVKQAGGMINKTLGDAKNFAKDFIKTTPGKVMMGLAALGLVNEMLTDNSSPLSPELNQKDTTGPINNDTLRAPASKANTGKKVLYSDPTSGTQFRMSAKSKDLIDQMNVARQLSSQTGGDTNINIQDDRSQVSNNWLERKFSELV